jgi:hypothetical protein
MVGELAMLRQRPHIFRFGDNPVTDNPGYKGLRR